MQCRGLVVFARTCSSNVFLFKRAATTEIYTLSLHDALPICMLVGRVGVKLIKCVSRYLHTAHRWQTTDQDRKSTRLNSSHGYISYAVFCLKKKNNAHPVRYVLSFFKPWQFFRL